ncbi:hypothetical protein, partial [Campylobacter portucalensis]|uniref:hypothetical protein n=1 Tax=Campylobacter portucalensis TaxID=2608384 RepID=UPI0018A6D3E9
REHAMTFRCIAKQKMKYPTKYLVNIRKSWLLWEKDHYYFKYAGKFLKSLCEYEKTKNKGKGNYDLLNCNQINEQETSRSIKNGTIEDIDWKIHYHKKGSISNSTIMYPMLNISQDGKYNPNQINQDIENCKKNNRDCVEVEVCTNFETDIAPFDKRLAS